jgi:hypothetical protein
MLESLIILLNYYMRRFLLLKLKKYVSFNLLYGKFLNLKSFIP